MSEFWDEEKATAENPAESENDKKEPEIRDYEADPWAEGETAAAANAGGSETAGSAEAGKDAGTGEPVVDVYLANLEARPTETAKPKKRRSFLQKASLFLVSAILFGAVAGGVFVGVQALNDHFSDHGEDTQKVLEGKSETDALPQDGTGEYKLDTTGTVNGDTETDETGESGNVTAVDVSDIVESVMPSVVAINCYTQNSYTNPFFGGSSGDSSLVLAGSGSGIIIGQNDTEVLVVTNNHVIDGAAMISLEFVDGTTAEASVKGTEPSSDLAVVSVPFSSLSDSTIASIRIARLGNSDDVKIGQMAIAIGNALGYGQSVTVGYISAKERQVTVDNVTYTLIQTDAAINPGNSGGALLNVKGEVIGINSVKYSDSSVEGMGFAIPISNIADLIEELSNREELSEDEYGFLGISNGKDITSEYANMLGISQGVYVRQIVADSPAEKAGMYAGDIITKVDNTVITCMSDLQNFLSYTKAGTTVTVTVQRMTQGEYREVELSVTLGNRPSDAK